MVLGIQNVVLVCLWRSQVCECLIFSWGSICGQSCLFINFGKAL